MAPRRLPEFIEPMQPKLGQPFDSDDYLYEIKWDGFRGLCFRDDRLRIIGRRRTDFTPSYPELVVLRRLPRGTVLDGEIVLFDQGKPSFHKLLRKRKCAAVSYIAFDLLYDRFQSVMDQPCEQRRDRLRQLIQDLAVPNVVMSEGVVGQGTRYFQKVIAEGLEGVVAKRLDSRYLPGARSSAWTKFKHRRELPCVIIGYLPNDQRGIQSVLVATDVEGELVYVGQVGSGLGAQLEKQLLTLLRPRVRPSPIVACKIRGTWVEPELLCTVSFNEWTADLQLRAPAFVRLHGH